MHARGRAAGGSGAWRPSWSDRPSTPPRSSRSARRSPGATSTRSTWSATPARRTRATRCRPCAGSPAARGALPATLLAGDGWAIACASPETAGAGRRAAWSRPGRSRAPARPPPPGRRELLGVGQGARRAHHDRRPGAQRPGPRRPRPAASRCRSCSRCGGGATCGRPSHGSWPSWPTGSTWPTCCARCCPGGSVTGAPKLAALAQIAALEPVGRGPSMGALGWLDARHARPRADHPYRRPSTATGCTCGPAAASPGTPTRGPRSPRPPPRPPRSAPPSPFRDLACPPSRPRPRTPRSRLLGHRRRLEVPSK